MSQQYQAKQATGVFGDLPVGASFTFDMGGGNWSDETWVKVGHEYATSGMRKLGISYWTKVSTAVGRPLIEVLFEDE